MSLCQLESQIPCIDFPAASGISSLHIFANNYSLGTGNMEAPAQVIEVHNAMSHLQGKPDCEYLKKRGVRLYRWAPDDPLRDVFLVHLGDYPSPEENQVHYRDIAKRALDATEIEIDPAIKLPAETFEFPSIPFLSRYNLRPHYKTSTPTAWDSAGIFSGDASNLDDLDTFWNLRAANIPELFVDPNRLDRYGDAIGSWEKAVWPIASGGRLGFEKGLALWASGRHQKHRRRT